MKNQNVITFGCRLNSFDSQIIKEKIDSKKHKNIFFINTCAVTKEAEEQAIKADSARFPCHRAGIVDSSGGSFHSASRPVGDGWIVDWPRR